LGRATRRKTQSESYSGRKVLKRKRKIAAFSYKLTTRKVQHHRDASGGEEKRNISFQEGEKTGQGEGWAPTNDPEVRDVGGRDTSCRTLRNEDGQKSID